MNGHLRKLSEELDSLCSGAEGNVSLYSDLKGVLFYLEKEGNGYAILANELLKAELGHSSDKIDISDIVNENSRYPLQYLNSPFPEPSMSYEEVSNTPVVKIKRYFWTLFACTIPVFYVTGAIAIVYWLYNI